MGAIASRLYQPIKTINLENRAHKVISKDKPTPAPSYPSTLKDIKRTKELDPNIDDKLNKKDSGLDDRLKEVYVTSLGRPEDDLTKEIKDKRTGQVLPKDRKFGGYFDYGSKEPDKIPYGRTTLRKAIEFISANQISPEEVTAAKIAYEYKLKEEDVESILKYIKTLEIYIPASGKDSAKFAGASTIKQQLEQQNLKKLETKEESEDIKEANAKT